MKVLNAGHVELLERMGGDHSVVRNARRCWRSEDKAEAGADRKLIRFLLQKGHITPFESMVFTFDVKAPLFIARQWFRHRIGSFNEESLRYCVAERDYYIPDKLSSDRNIEWKVVNDASFEAYFNAIEYAGIPREQARALLPMGIYTKFYWTVNGSSLINFLRLRLDPSAQAEMREYARAVLSLAREVAPITFEELVI